MKYIISYMARKMWDSIVEGLPWCGLMIILAAVGAAAGYALVAVATWLQVDPGLLFFGCISVLGIILLVYHFVELYLKAKRHCATENEPVCEHEFFKCRVPPGAGGGAISHWVCKKCRWNESKKAFVPDEIWRDWIVPQLEEERWPEC